MKYYYWYIINVCNINNIININVIEINESINVCNNEMIMKYY